MQMKCFVSVNVLKEEISENRLLWQLLEKAFEKDKFVIKICVATLLLYMTYCVETVYLE